VQAIESMSTSTTTPVGDGTAPPTDNSGPARLPENFPSSETEQAAGNVLDLRAPLFNIADLPPTTPKTVAQLRSMLQERNLKDTGKKDILVARLTDWHQAQVEVQRSGKTVCDRDSVFILR
jgi:hypothetical protein